MDDIRTNVNHNNNINNNNRVALCAIAGGQYFPPGALGVGGPFVMDAAGQQVLYVQMGETVYFHMGDTLQCIPGPATVSISICLLAVLPHQIDMLIYSLTSSGSSN